MSTLFLKCKDHTVSSEEFDLIYDQELEMLRTEPIPALEKLGAYYESEDYISHTDNKRNLFEKAYHIVKQHALSQKVNLISKINSGNGELLDFGAGTGDFLHEAAERGWNAYGIEPNTEAASLAKAKGVKLNSSINDFKNEQFDVISLWHVLEHIPDLEEKIKEIARVLKNQGHALIAVPNYKSYDAEYYKEFWAAYDVPRHLWHFSKISIEKLFEKEGLRLVATKPMLFDSFYVSMLSEKYKNGRMNMIKAFCIGFLSNLKGFATKEYSSHIYILKKEKK